MKRWTTLLIVICMLGITIPAMGAMSISKMRQNTRFLTDRMAYELQWVEISGAQSVSLFYENLYRYAVPLHRWRKESC